MLKKNCKRAMLLLVCGVLLFSALILDLDYGKNLSLIDYPHVSAYIKYIPFGF